MHIRTRRGNGPCCTQTHRHSSALVLAPRSALKIGKKMEGGDHCENSSFLFFPSYLAGRRSGYSQRHLAPSASRRSLHRHWPNRKVVCSVMYQ